MIDLNTCNCKRDVLEAVNAFVNITYSLFFNTSIYHVYYVRDSSVLTSTHTNNSRVLSTRNTNLRISHSEFFGNANNVSLFISGGNIGNEFKNNNVIQGIVDIYDGEGMPTENCNEFADNNATFDIYISSCIMQVGFKFISG